MLLMTFTTTQDPYSFLGIDTVHMFTSNLNTTLDPDKVKFRKYKDKNGDEIIEYRTKYINVRFKERTERKKEYWFYFSLAKLYNGCNLYPDSPLGQEDLQEFLTLKLGDIGITIKNWKKIKVSRLDIFQNVKLSSKYSEYVHLLELLEVPRTEFRKESNTIYFENKSWALCAYDKREELQLPEGSDEILRIELRLLRSHKIKHVLKTNVLLSVFDNIDYVFNTFTAKAFGFLRQIESMADIIPLDCSNIQEALTLYYSNTKKNRIMGFTEETLKILHIPFTPTTKVSTKKKPLANRNKEAVRKAKQRSAKAVKVLKQTGILASDFIHGFGGLAQELIEAFLDKQAKKSNFEVI